MSTSTQTALLVDNIVAPKCCTNKHSESMTDTDEELFNRVITSEYILRLQKIKQLGLYPYAEYSRYEHSIGVYEETKKYLRNLEEQTPASINPFHKRCVKMAGLLHDIGHGPFSHFWERVAGNSFKHERNGLELVKEIFSNIRLSEDNSLNDYGISLIQALIFPVDYDPDGNKLEKKKNFQWEFEKDEFLFEIVNNETCNIDVDRLDYLKRDWAHCKDNVQNIGVNVDEYLRKIDELFEGARITEDRKHIQYNDNHIENINCMFQLRELFHKHIYQVREAKILEDLMFKMIEIAKKQQKDFTKINSRNRELFLHLDDKHIVDLIKESTNLNLIRYFEVFNNFRRKIQISEEASERISIKYKYRIKEGIKKCIRDPGNQLIMNYSFEDTCYYSIIE